MHSGLEYDLSDLFGVGIDVRRQGVLGDMHARASGDGKGFAAVLVPVGVQLAGRPTEVRRAVVRTDRFALPAHVR